MAIDPEYTDAIKGFEGYSPTAAWDYKQSSSGYGTKAQPGDENLAPDQLKAIHEQRYRDEIAKAEAHVDSVNPNLPPGARAALTSLTYNAGPGWSQSGLGEMVRSGDLQGAAQRFLEYNKAGGQVNPGLVARRAKEAAWFNQSAQPAPVTPASPPSAPVAPPVNLIPPQAPPIFAPPPQQPQQQAQPQEQGGGSMFNAMPAQMAQAPPIFAPVRRSPDLTKLRAAFPMRPFFNGRG